MLAFPFGLKAPAEPLLEYQLRFHLEWIAHVADNDVETKLRKMALTTTHKDAVAAAAAAAVEVEVDAASDADADGEVMQSCGTEQQINVARRAAPSWGINNDVNADVHVGDVIVIVDEGGGEGVSEDVNEGEVENDCAEDEAEGAH